MEPCEPGFVECRMHRQQLSRRQMAVLLESAQMRVLEKVERALDPAVTELVHLATEARNESTRLAAIDKLLTLGGFANLRIEADGAVALDPQSRDKALMEMIRNLKAQDLGEIPHDPEPEIIDVDSTESG